MLCEAIWWDSQEQFDSPEVEADTEAATNFWSLHAHRSLSRCKYLRPGKWKLWDWRKDILVVDFVFNLPADMLENKSGNRNFKWGKAKH